ncbi:hypothetical protein [Paraferrimonas sedimenticola]|uniref:DUF4007 domain-containing protein n=1 Tax=Paraferrimonas sedimenticola TaxID=375674 RepID=A0AA37W1X4_9GAMM|nr:hypothetical protein [Paraferrimonas sedimenticola]GLP97002.1 hypothetical protein GCM10007895_23080 [Paraferrimonas sedimenticola]
MQKLGKQLPTSFAKDFKPERRLISNLLKYALSENSGDKHEISEKTGIPTGVSSGKVEPTIHYASGMGLVYSSKHLDKWELRLTPLGKTVLEEDPYLTESVTLWLMHLMLCRPYKSSKANEPSQGIADQWFALFALGKLRLGNCFSSGEYAEFLSERLGSGSDRVSMANLILRSYEEESCLGLVKALEKSTDITQSHYTLAAAPDNEELYPALAAYFILLWDEFFDSTEQLHLEELIKTTYLFSTLNWTKEQSSRWLDWLADHGVVQLDRQTGDTLVLRTTSTSKVLKNIYSELI